MIQLYSNILYIVHLTYMLNMLKTIYIAYCDTHRYFVKCQNNHI